MQNSELFLELLKISLRRNADLYDFYDQVGY